MSKCVLLLEDDHDLADLVRELLSEEGYQVYHVTNVEALLALAAQRSPCVALLDSTNSSSFNLWHLGPKLDAMGVPPVAFTAHASAVEEFRNDPRGFVGVVPKPFDADEFIELVENICWEDHHAASC